MNTRKLWEMGWRPVGRYAIITRESDGYAWNAVRLRWEPMDMERYEEFATAVGETKTADPETIPAPAETPAAPGETKEGKDETRSALDDARDAAEPKDELTGGAKPPEDGLCRECKRRRRLNRLKLCYPCFA